MKRHGVQEPPFPKAWLWHLLQPKPQQVFDGAQAKACSKVLICSDWGDPKAWITLKKKKKLCIPPRGLVTVLLCDLGGGGAWGWEGVCGNRRQDGWLPALHGAMGRACPVLPEGCKIQQEKGLGRAGIM